MSAPFPNVYTHRKVAETSAKACDVCYKPSTSVLITLDKKDFFFICPVHLKDRTFCSPKIDEEALKAKKEKQLAEEKEKLKKEYEEKQRKKKEAESKKQKDKSPEEEDPKSKDKGADDAKDPISKEKSETDAPDTSQEEEPRIFELKSVFYQQRLQRKRQTEAAKRDRERTSKPNYFPSVPIDLPGR